MYQIEAASALRKTARAARSRHGWSHVSRNVLALGCTSLLTDVSSEMVATVLPIYLVLYLGLTPLQFGLVDGLYHGVTALLRLVGGLASDRTRRHKEVAAAGYGVSALCKIGLVAVGGTWPLIATIVAIDRAAKGLRTAPRDALISLSSERDALATSFGVHRALDSAGAMLGPLVALAILTAAPDAFDLVFVASFSVAVVGFGVLWLFVERVRGPDPPATTVGHLGVTVHSLLATRGFGALTVAGSVVSLVTISDSFLYLILQQRAGFGAGLFPLLYVGTAACYLALAVPVGVLADRLGHRRTFLAGCLVLAVAYLVAAAPVGGTVNIVLCLVLLGGYYAMTDGVLMALASSMLSSDVRGTGFAVLTTLSSMGRLVASFGFGAAWAAYGPTRPLLWFFTALLGATVIAGVALGRIPANGERQTIS